MHYVERVEFEGYVFRPPAKHQVLHPAPGPCHMLWPQHAPHSFLPFEANRLPLEGASSAPAPAGLPRLRPQVIYSLTPIWSALIASATLGSSENMGTLSWAGGAVIVLASILAAVFSRKAQSKAAPA